MTVYSGTCVGGPWDGRKYQSITPVITVNIRSSDCPWWSRDLNALSKPTIFTGTYQHKRGVSEDFWVYDGEEKR